MDLKRLLQDSKIESYQSRPEEIASKIGISESNLRAAKKIVAINDPDVDDAAYKEAYNVILEAAMALMYYRGYRPARDRGSQHLNVQQFVESEFADDFDPSVLDIFGKARQTRNMLQYDVSGATSHADVEDLISKAEEFVMTAKGILGT